MGQEVHTPAAVAPPQASVVNLNTSSNCLHHHLLASLLFLGGGGFTTSTLLDFLRRLFFFPSFCREKGGTTRSRSASLFALYLDSLLLAGRQGEKIRNKRRRRWKGGAGMGWSCQRSQSLVYSRRNMGRQKKTCFHFKTHYILIQMLYFCFARDDIHASSILTMLKWDVNKDCR